MVVFVDPIYTKPVTHAMDPAIGNSTIGRADLGFSAESARFQHKNMVSAARAAGGETVVFNARQCVDDFLALEPHHSRAEVEDQCADLVFARDTMFFAGDQLITLAPRHPNRKLEPEILLASLIRHTPEIVPGHVHKLNAVRHGCFVEGGDLAIDVASRVLFANPGPRSNPEAIEEVGAILKNSGWIDSVEFLQVQPQFSYEMYHLDTFFTVLPNRQVLVVWEALDEASRAKLHSRYDDASIIRIDIETNRATFCVNQFAVGKTILSPNMPEQFAKILEARGLTVQALDVSELVKLGAGVRCSISESIGDSSFWEAHLAKLPGFTTTFSAA